MLSPPIRKYPWTWKVNKDRVSRESSLWLVGNVYTYMSSSGRSVMTDVVVSRGSGR